MQPQQWEKIEEILNSALDLEGSSRSEFLDAACAGDAQLRREVETLIKSYEKAEDFIDKPIVGEILKKNEYTGKRVGAYVLREEIGRGGMGVVYRADRADGEFKQKVAVKLIKGGIESEFIAKRFRRERQILATLKNPFIARLLDGGTDPHGAPYLVMELVEGKPLNRYRNEKNLSVRESLQLFLKICSAVADAHRHSILHRDLKPSNILIKIDGTPKLLDFGISKMLEPQPIDQDLIEGSTNATTEFVRLLTPDYASPEQVRGEKLSPASDIYSLGVVLYEFLTGVRPYAFPDYSPATIARVINDAEPENLQRKIGAEKIDELNAVVQKMMAKKVRDRYASISDLIRDLEKYLDRTSDAAEAHRPQIRAEIHSSQTKRTTLAVLPFKVISKTLKPDTSDQLLGLGIADSLITKLSGIKQFVVRPTGAITKYTKAEPDYSEIARELKVDNLLDGLIFQVEDRLRVTVQLINTSNESALWAAKFNEKLTDIFEIQDSISEQVAGALAAELTDSERANLARHGTKNLEAYDTYLRGRATWHSYTEQGLAKAREFFEKAVALDPNFAAAYSGIADFYVAAGIISLMPPADAFRIARDFASKAVALDSELAEAYASLGFAVWAYDWDAEEAERLFQKCFSLNKNYAPAYEWHAHVLASQGRFDEAIASMLAALEIDPKSSQLTAMTAYIYHNACRHAEGAKFIEKALELEPENYLALQGFGWMYPPLGRAREAIPLCRKAVELSNRAPFCLWVLAQVYAGLGERAEAEKLIAELKLLSASRYVSPYYFAMLSATLGKRDEAFKWLEKVIADRDYWAQWLNVEYRFDSLRSDPRFSGILSRVHKQSNEKTFGRAPETSPTRRFAQTKEAKTSSFQNALSKPIFIAALVIVVLTLSGWYWLHKINQPTANSEEKLQNLTKNVAEDLYPKISPDGKFIVFTSNRDGIPEIYTMRTDGGDVRRLTMNETIEQVPNWTPDGKHIVFERINNERNQSDIWMMDADGRNELNLTQATGINSRPAVSPDGGKIAFSSNREGRFAIFLMNIDGTDQHRLTNYPKIETEPAWSPDGTRLAFSRRIESNITNIVSVKADGSDLIYLTNSMNSINNCPAFSPDGRLIAFQSNRNLPANHVDLWVMNADGSNPQLVTTDHKNLNGEPNWTNNNRQIIFNTDRDGNYEIYKADISNIDLQKP